MEQFALPTFAEIVPRNCEWCMERRSAWTKRFSYPEHLALSMNTDGVSLHQRAAYLVRTLYEGATPQNNQVTVQCWRGSLLAWKFFVPSWVFDMPAKAAVLDQKQFNGEFGCTTCLHPGTRLNNGSRTPRECRIQNTCNRCSRCCICR